MSSGVGLCVLGLLCLHSFVHGQDQAEAQSSVPLLCDDPFVEKVVNLAVHKFNERLSTGHVLALFQIKAASKSEDSSGSVYSLKFTSRRSNCPAGSTKPWTDCDYLPSGRKKPISCNATVQVTDLETQVQQVHCLLDDFVVPEKASCLGCPESIGENSEDLKVPMLVSISKFNSNSNSTHLFTLHDVGYATRQVVAGFRFKLRFDLRKSICAKAEHKDLHELCVPDEQDVEFVNCNSTVDVAPWRLEPAEAHIKCEPGALTPMTFSRRRPPGWSPLRNFLFKQPPPTQAPPKEESSEEDVAVPKPSASPDGAADAVNDDALHCPSKPWKHFHAVHPTEAPAKPDSPAPVEEATFSDTDLLN